MFRGRFDHSIDVKGRLSIPSRYREVLQSRYGDEHLILTGFDRCLWGYPLKEWEEIEKRIAKLPQFKREVKAIQRLFVSAAMDCPVDNQGRILIPANLRSYARMEKDIVIVGMTRRIEFWDKDLWQEEIEKAESNVEWEALAEFDL